MKTQITILTFVTFFLMNFAKAGINPPETHQCDRFETTNCIHQSLEISTNSTILECEIKDGDSFALNVKYLDDVSETSKTGCAKATYSRGNPVSYYQVKFCKYDVVTGNILNRNEQGKLVRGARFSTEDNCTLTRSHNPPSGGHKRNDTRF